jgi:hypothetical protein
MSILEGNRYCDVIKIQAVITQFKVFDTPFVSCTEKPNSPLYIQIPFTDAFRIGRDIYLNSLGGFSHPSFLRVLKDAYLTKLLIYMSELTI